ncbi:hypothetical protein EP47_01975 [Legionella norrlandica]|uniref:Uncharacterized protein n=1 Tax=Legionella norrlandica TaxID=1498499 RepID=A0A0A2SSP2_9GAMM|nr:hypothetical protein EP47_01975 [Legionella norrlandica]
MVMVNSIAQAAEADWMYETPKIDDVVSTVSVSLDGTCVLMVNEGFSEMSNMLPNRQKQGLVDKLKSAITYFKNQRQRMNYNFYQMNNLPIGSGVTEAACKTLIKQRLCQSE